MFLSIFHIQDTAKIWDAINKLFWDKNMNRKMIVKEKLKSTRENRENVGSYLTHIKTLWDELAAIGEKVDDKQIVRTALKGFQKHWDAFVQVVSRRSDFPTWEHVRSDFT